jgi:phosphoglycolate phosphatase
LALRLLDLGGHDPATDIVRSGSPFAAGTVEDLARLFAGAFRGGSVADLVVGIDGIFRDGGAETAVAEDGARGVVEDLTRAGFVCGLATNDSVAGMTTSPGRAGLYDVFAYKVAADSGHGAKPEPGMALAFAHFTGLAPDVLAVVGDSVHDLEMARRAGFGLRIAVLSGPGLEADLRPLADLVLPSIRELPAALSNYI